MSVVFAFFASFIQLLKTFCSYPPYLTSYVTPSYKIVFYPLRLMHSIHLDLLFLLYYWPLFLDLRQRLHQFAHGLKRLKHLANTGSVMERLILWLKRKETYQLLIKRIKYLRKEFNQPSSCNFLILSNRSFTLCISAFSSTFSLFIARYLTRQFSLLTAAPFYDALIELCDSDSRSSLM